MMTRTSCPASRLFQRTALAAALALSFVTSAQALTLSRPVLQSKQGEALRAEIDVTEITYTEQRDLQATLAGPEVYKAAKVELPMSNGAPLDVQIEVMRRPSGQLYLKVSSKQPVQSNTIDLLLDLNWATGRLLRDVSLSVTDAGNKAKPAIQAPTEVVQPSVRPTTSANTSGKITIQRGDTASELMAAEMSEDVSLEQMLLALLRQNPDAFVNNNVNRMKAGALISLPTEEQARSISKEQARREIRIQAKDFEAYRAELAARAPGGKVAQASKDVAGKLDATIENKKLKADQDKLTLAKPGQGKGEAEDKIAKQLEAQEVASRAAEISRNIAELGQIAAATAAASEAASGPVVNANVPASAAEPSNDWLEKMMQDPNTPYSAAALVAVLLLLAVWRRRTTAQDEDNIEGLPPLNVKFDLDLPPHDDTNAAMHAHTEEVMTHADEHHEHPHDHDHVPHHAEPDMADDTHEEVQAVRPTLEMPSISLDLDEPPVNDHPFQVRMDLADELWKLGQQHTSRALMEEVANEASGAVKEKALQWLAERG